MPKNPKKIQKIPKKASSAASATFATSTATWPYSVKKQGQKQVRKKRK
jgi:hypothetical protein